MQQGNQIRLKTQDTVTVFHIEGDITVASEPFLQEAYENANQEGASKILIAISEDAYINSGGIAVLIQLLAETHRKSQQVGIAGLSDHFKKIFNMVGITRFAEIFSSLDEGMRRLSEG